MIRRGPCLSLLGLVLLALSTAPAAAQERAFELSQQSVLTLHADGDELWIGTEDGLNHVRDGRITQYRHDPRDAASLPANKIRSIAPGPDGLLWIGVANQGVVLWDPAGWVVERRAARLGTALGNDPRALLPNDDGTVWAGFSRGGLELMAADGVERTVLRRRSGRSGLVDARVTALARAADGLVWVGTPTGVELYDPTARSSQRCDACATPPVRSLARDERGLWIGTAEGTFLLTLVDGEPSDLQFVEGSTTRVNTVTRDSGGRVWVGTAQGLLSIDAESLEAFEVKLSERRGGVLSVHEDRDGQVWLGTMTGGLQPLQLDGSASDRSVASSEARADDGFVVTSFAQAPSGRVFLGSMDRGLLVQEARGSLPRPMEAVAAQELAAAIVMALLVDGDGRLWVGTKQGGLARIEGPNGHAVSYRHAEGDPTSLPVDGVMSLFEDEAGTLWVGTFGGGLSSFDPVSDSFRNLTTADGLKSDRITAIAQASEGGLWVGTLGGGLHLLDAERRVVRVFASEGSAEVALPDDTVFSVYETADGTVWVGTPGGLTRLDRAGDDHMTSSSRTYTEADGLSNAAVYSVIPDENGYLWLSTNHGLSRFDPTTESFEVFDETHGLQKEYNFGAAMKSAEGKLYFGGMTGYDEVDPDAPLASR